MNPLYGSFDSNDTVSNCWWNKYPAAILIWLDTTEKIIPCGDTNKSLLRIRILLIVQKF